ncbi:hypothetical protein NX059_011094 [Plenodomus lindquistii]|nr:hypothetical protein NX059_011094 [Plenodomus lindquistii]
MRPGPSANPAVASGLLEGALEGQDEDEGDDDDKSADMNAVNKTLHDKKKRKRTNKKKIKMAAAMQQTPPPRVYIGDLFLNRPYPEGQVFDYSVKDEDLQRTTDEELRHLVAANNMDDKFLNEYARLLKSIASKLASEIEDGVRALVGHQGIETGDALKAGMGLPTGLCLNNVAAHWTPNAGAKEIILHHHDVVSVDFGVHVTGRIVDSAFTVAFNPVYDNLLTAVKSATNTGLKEAGIDARMDHISEAIQEV